MQNILNKEINMKLSKKNLLIAFILLICIAGAYLSTINAHEYEKTGYVTKVIDGDTIEISNQEEKIRLWGVDTPELNTEKGQEVKENVTEQLLGKEVTLDIDDKKEHDHYGRTLAKVYLNGTDINQWLLTEKLARVMYIPPSEFEMYTGGLSPEEFEKYVVPKTSTSTVGTNSDIVYIATFSGTKYHYDRNCKALKCSMNVNNLSLSEAKNRGYTLCGWED
jgi:endonuclease YncB( thermonuclease family)